MRAQRARGTWGHILLTRPAFQRIPYPIVRSIINGPMLLFYSGRLHDEALVDQVSAEVLEIAVGYLITGP